MQHEFSPDPVTFLCILKACSNMGLINKGIEIHRKVSEEGFLRDNTLVVDMYAKCGALGEAVELFE